MRLALGSVSAVAVSTASYAHTNSVAFRVSESAVSDCVGGAASADGKCYDVEVFYGTWHANTSTPEGSLAIFSLSDEERAAFASDPAANPNVGTQVVGASAQGGTDVPFSMSSEFVSGTDYRDTTQLPEGFVAGDNYFYSGTVYDQTAGTYDYRIFGSDGDDYTNSVTEQGLQYTVGSGVYEHQSALAVGLGLGSYRFYYDATSVFSATWMPDTPINQAFFTLGAGGELEVPSAKPVTPPIDTNADFYTVEQINGGEVLPSFQGGTLTTSGSGQVAQDFEVTEQNGTISVGEGDAIDFAGTFSGAGGMTKAGQGVLELSGTNTFSGGVTVVGGGLSVAADANMGDAAGNVTLDGGALQATASFATARDLSVGSQDGELAVSGDSVLGWTGTVSGAGELTKSGDGLLILSGSNSFTGGISVAGGAVSVDADENLGAAEGGVRLDGGALAVTESFGTARSLVVGPSGGELAVGQDSILEWGGSISGAGALIKSGEGLVMMTGTNNATGGVAIHGGGLAVDAAEALGTTGVTLSGGSLHVVDGFTSSAAFEVGAEGGGLFVSSGEQLTIGGRLSGSQGGDLSQVGNVAYVGDETHSMNGRYTVTNGDLAVHSAFGVNDLIVDQQSRLLGTGRIDSDVLLQGELAAGASPGTLTVAGDLTLTETSTFTVEVDGAVYSAAGGAGSYDRTALLGDGVFTANGTIAPILRGITGDATNTFSPSLGERYRVVTTENTAGIAGAFESLRQPSDGLAAGTRFAVIYGDDFIDLAITPVSYGAFGFSTGNQNAVAVGSVFDAMMASFGYGDDSDASAFLHGLYLLGEDEIGRAMVQASGEIHAFALADVSHSIRGLNASIGSAAFESEAGESVWATASGSRFSADETDATSSYTSDTGNILVGKHLYDDGVLRFGLAFGHSQSTISAPISGTADQSTAAMAAYFLQQYDALDVQVIMGLAHSSFDTERSVALAGGPEANEASGDAHGIFASLGAGYRVDLTDDITGRAWGRIDGQDLTADAYSETGSSITGLDVAKEQRDSFRISVGYDLSGALPAEVGTGTWGAGVGLTRNADGDSVSRNVSMHGANWGVYAPDTSDTVATFNAGIALKPSRQSTIKLGVFGAAGENWDAVGAQVQLSTRW